MRISLSDKRWEQTTVYRNTSFEQRHNTWRHRVTQEALRLDTERLVLPWRAGFAHHRLKSGDLSSGLHRRRVRPLRQLVDQPLVGVVAELALVDAAVLHVPVLHAQEPAVVADVLQGDVTAVPRQSAHLPQLLTAVIPSVIVDVGLVRAVQHVIADIRGLRRAEPDPSSDGDGAAVPGAVQQHLVSAGAARTRHEAHVWPAAAPVRVGQRRARLPVDQQQGVAAAQLGRVRRVAQLPADARRGNAQHQLMLRAEEAPRLRVVDAEQPAQTIVHVHILARTQPRHVQHTVDERQLGGGQADLARLVGRRRPRVHVRGGDEPVDAQVTWRPAGVGSLGNSRGRDRERRSQRGQIRNRVLGLIAHGERAVRGGQGAVCLSRALFMTVHELIERIDALDEVAAGCEKAVDAFGDLFNVLVSAESVQQERVELLAQLDLQETAAAGSGLGRLPQVAVHQHRRVVASFLLQLFPQQRLVRRVGLGDRRPAVILEQRHRSALLGVVPTTQLQLQIAQLVTSDVDANSTVPGVSAPVDVGHRQRVADVTVPTARGAPHPGRDVHPGGRRIRVDCGLTQTLMGNMKISYTPTEE